MNVQIDDVLSVMPHVRERVRVNHRDGRNSDIIKTLQENFDEAVHITRKASKLFRGKTEEETCENVWNFLKQNIRYKADGIEFQDIRLPNVLLSTGEGDCKSFSLFCCAVLSNLGLSKCCFRFTSYRGERIPSHVYCVVKRNDGSEIICDPVFDYFNKQKQPITSKRDMAMIIRTLSGLGEIESIADAKALFVMLCDKYNHLGVESVDRFPLKKAIEHLKNVIARNGNGLSAKVVTNGLFEGSEVHSPTRTEVRSPTKTSTYANTRGNITVTGGAGRGATYVIIPPGDGVGSVFKTVALAIPRNAYLELCKLNIFNLGKHVKTAIQRNENAVKDKWQKLGGNFSKLKSAVMANLPSFEFTFNQAYTSTHTQAEIIAQLDAAIIEAKASGNATAIAYALQRKADYLKSISGIRGPELAIPAILAAAAPVIAAMASVIKAVNPQAGADLDALFNDAKGKASAAGLSWSDPLAGGNVIVSDDENKNFLGNVPWWGWAAAAAGGYFLLK